MFKGIIFWLICLFPPTLLSQENWLRKDGGLNNDEVLDMTETSDGNFLQTGYFNSTSSFGDFTLTSSGYGDIFLQKIDNEGETIWVKKFGGNKTDRAVAIASDLEGNSYLTGFFTESANFDGTVLNEIGDSLEIFILKLSPLGNVVWVVACGGISDDYAHGIDVDDDGNVLVTGQFKGEAQFGSITLTSDFYEDSNLHSYDVFTTKLNSNGDFLWAKKGSSDQDDRGLDITSDTDGNVYVCGQFSDTATFETTHYNSVMNAGFVIRYSPSGQEDWFYQMSASQVLCNDIECDEDNMLLVTGDYIGQLGIFGEEIVLIPYDYIYNLFLIKTDLNGTVIWTSHVGSDSEVSAKAAAIGEAGEYYITGTFKCRFDELSLNYGSGLFNSAGYRDVYIIRFENDGSKTWERQFGGPKDDFCSAIAYSGDPDSPLIAGGFSGFFNVPSDENFDFILYENSYPGLDNKLPTCSEYCGNDWYPLFSIVEGIGGRDIFFTKPVLLDREPYDFYNRSHPGPPCDFSVVEPCVNVNYGFQFCDSDANNFCSDSIMFCASSGTIVANENTGSPGYIGPLYNYIWNTGEDQRQISVSSDGMYFVEVTREDQCWSFSDSIYVTLHPPTCPTITDSEGVNIETACSAFTINVCFPDTILLDGGNIQYAEYWWASQNNTVVNDSLLYVNTSGSYEFFKVDTFQCTTSTEIQINVLQTLDTISPYLIVESYSGIVEDYDSLIFCSEQYSGIEYNILDAFGASEFLLQQNLDVNWTMNFDGEYSFSCNFCGKLYNFFPEQTGWYEMTAQPILNYPYPCEGIEMYPTLVHHVYVTVYPSPEINVSINGGPWMCEGDTILLVAHGGDVYDWSSNGIVEYISNDSVLVSGYPYYSVMSSIQEGPCYMEDYSQIMLSSYPVPEITMLPENGIVCPGDSVLLTCEAGLNYQWVGPLGEMLGTEQSLWVNTPGFYYCIQTNFEGCTRESNFVEAKEYNTPYLIVEPGTDLCVNGSITLFVLTNDEDLIQWQPPLVGSGATVVVETPGLYQVSVSLCGVTTNMEVNITSSDTPSQINSEQLVICSGDSLLLEGNPGMQAYLWYPSEMPVQYIYVQEPGWYVLTTFDELGCMGTDSLLVYSFDEVAPVVQDTIICANQSIDLIAQSELPVYWASDPLGIQVLGNDFTYTTPIIQNDVSFYVFSSDSSCSNMWDDVQISVYPSSIEPTVSFVGNNCNGGTVELIVQSSDSIDYSITTPSGEVIFDDYFLISPVTQSDEGWYTVISFDQYCESPNDSAFFDVVFTALQDVITDSDLLLCEGDTLILESPVEAGEYMWTQPDGTTSESSQLIIEPVSPEDAGNYSLEVSSADCFYEINDLWIDVVPLPEFNLSEENVFCRNGFLTAVVPDLYDVYLWSSGENSNSITVQDEGWLWVQVTNLPDCHFSDSLFIEDIDCMDDFINFFSPNNDGKNDEVNFGTLRIPIEKVTIFNRWGGSIAELGAPFIWDGKSDSGELVAEGTYFYVLHSSAPREHLDDVKGYLFVTY